MATGGIEMSIAHHPTVFHGESVGSLPDELLIERFLTHAGEEAENAFRAIVIRHGPMVLGVCRSVLNQHQDAEDAFQATFVVLARKASSIHDRRVLGRWLYEVAYRIAIRAKSTATRRRTLERQVTEMSVTAPETEAGWNELRPVIHEEVSRLPEKYRTPVVLCYLEGKTNEEVAQLLRWPVGTVKGRLSRARDLLRSRLTRRGLVLSAAFLLTALSREAVFAEVVPPRLIETSVQAAMQYARGGPLAASAARALSPKLALAIRLAVVTGLLIVISTALASAAGITFMTHTSLPFSFNPSASFLSRQSASSACHSVTPD